MLRHAHQRENKSTNCLYKELAALHTSIICFSHTRTIQFLRIQYGFFTVSLEAYANIKVDKKNQFDFIQNYDCYKSIEWKRC